MHTSPNVVHTTAYQSIGQYLYIIWSILLHSMLREWDKREITDNLKKIIKHLYADIKVLKAKVTDVKTIQNKISDYREDISTVMHGNLKKYIDQFSSGWIAYLSPSNMKELKEKCLQLKKEFEEKNNIKSGTVKVTHERSFLKLS